MIRTSFDVQTIGEVLREKRKQKGLHVKQVAETIRIRVEYIKALETGDYGAFPSEVYVKGFLKNYAKFLGIGREKALAMYRRENKEIRQAQIETNKIKRPKLNFNLTPEKLILAIVSIVTISIVYYIATQVGAIIQTPELALSSPVLVTEEQTGRYETDKNTLDIKGKVSAGSTLKLNGDEIITNNLQQFEVKDLEINPGENEFSFIAESQFGRATKVSLIVTRTIQKELEAAPPAEETEPTPITEMITEIEVIDGDANVLVVTDSNT